MQRKSAKIFKNGRNQAVRLPRDFEFEGVDEVMIEKREGKLILSPVRPDWASFAALPGAAKGKGDDFLEERPEIFDPKRVDF